MQFIFGFVGGFVACIYFVRWLFKTKPKGFEDNIFKDMNGYFKTEKD